MSRSSTREARGVAVSEFDAGEMGHILIIEKDEEHARRLAEDLALEGYRVDWQESGLEGLERAQTPSVDLVILELSLPDLDGFRVLRCLRHRGFRVPAMVLSDRDNESDKVLSLRTGADDYVLKPYGAGELLARVEVLLRRSRQTRGSGGHGRQRMEDPSGRGAPAGPSRRRGSGNGGRPAESAPASGPTDATISFNDVQVDPPTRTVRKGGEDVQITPREFDLLMALVRRGGAAATRAELLEEVWTPKLPDTVRTVDTHVYELRRKLEDDPSKPRHLLTVRKVGYRLRRS
jgi:two-component system, OmpR family, alkaline phosphatase synthesis response regulator PhoP